jgi:hypothetical protein
MNEQDILKGAKAIGEFIGETQQTAERMCRRGDLPAYKHSRGWRMRKSDYMRITISKPAA